MKLRHLGLCVLGAMAFALSRPALAAGKTDIFVYTETTQWIGQALAQAEADIFIKAVKGKPGVGDVVNLGGKDIAKWTQDHTVKDGHHLIVLYGDFPPQIYPDKNAKPDGSLAEEFLDSGNTFANSADYFFWGLNGRNEEGGIKNMMDIPNIVQWDDNTPMKVTTEGKKVAPSITDYATDRPFHLDQIAGTDWEAELVLASNTGDAKGTRADPVIVHNKKTNGRLIQVYQTADQQDPKGKVLSEIILNFYLEKVGSLSVEPKGKASTTWGNLKRR